MSTKSQRFLAIVFVAFGVCCSRTSALAAPVSGSHTVLVTGGAGYIGSHTCLELLEAKNDYKVVVVDSLDNSSEESLRRVRELTKCDPDRLQFRECDIRDKVGLGKSESTEAPSCRVIPYSKYLSCIY